MTKISSNLLDDTLNLIQLARETALANGKAEQASRLTPVVNEMRNIVTNSRDLKSSSSSASAPISSTPASAAMGVMGNSDFMALLSAVSKTNPTPAASSVSSVMSSSSLEKNQIVTAMANGGMSELDIARQMGMTRGEVQMIMSINGS